MGEKNVTRIPREEYVSRASDPYRIVCPNGHVAVTLKTSDPVAKQSGGGPMKTTVWVHSDNRGREWSGAFWCYNCAETHTRAYDKKTDEWLEMTYEPHNRTAGAGRS